MNLIKRNIYFLILFVVIFIGLVTCTPSEVNQIKSTSFLGGNDLTSVELSIKNADTLGLSQPDSAIVQYKLAIQNLYSFKKDRRVKQLLASAYIEIAFVYSEKGEQDAAWENDSLALTALDGENDKQLLARIKNIEGMLFLNEGDYKQALSNYEEAFSLAKEVGDIEMLAKIFSNQGRIYLYQGDVEKAIEILTESLEFAKQTGSKLLIAGSNLNIGIVYRNMGNRDSALVRYNAAKDLFQEIGDKNGLMLCYQSIGTICFYNSDYTGAIENYEMSKDLAHEMNDQPNASKAFQNLGEVYLFLGDYKIATDNYYNSLKITEALGDELGSLKTFSSLGNLYYMYEEYPQAINFYRRALQLSNKLNYATGTGKAYTGIANVYSELHQSDSARFYYFKALDFYDEDVNAEPISNLYANLGDDYANTNQYSLAEKYLQKALDLKIQLSLDEDEANVRLLLAEMFFQMAPDFGMPYYRKAEKEALEGYRISERVGVKLQVRQACEVLKNIYRELRKPEKALEYFEQYKLLSDSLFNEDKIDALASAKARWNVEKKQEEIDNLEKVQQLNQEIIQRTADKNQLQKLIIGAIAALFILTLGITFVVALYIRRKRETLYQRQIISNSVLRMQNIRNSISPHFVFNTLNNIWDNIEDRESSKRQFDNLTRLIRQSLVNTEKIAIPLKEEISFVESFIELQKFRMAGELTVYWEISPGLSDQLVPGMILQIPVENAIKHGLAPKKDNRLLKINVTKSASFLNINIQDNGIGMQKAQSSTKGTGTGLKVLTNTIHILNQSNEKKMSYEILYNTEEEGNGTKVNIRIPINFNYEIY